MRWQCSQSFHSDKQNRKPRSIKEMKESTGRMNIQTIDILAVNTTETNVNAKLIVGNDDDDIDMVDIFENFADTF